MKTLYEQWIDYKNREKEAQEKRRLIEDELTQLLGISEQLDGTKNIDSDGFKIKVVGRLTHKVDGDKVKEIATENGLEQYINTLFRWKPELDVRTFKSIDKGIADAFQDAITTSSGRPSYTIERGE